jgi:hypothetical protein
VRGASDERLYEGDRMFMSVYIRGGSTETFKVPLGTFELKYACGTQWQDYWNLFGPSNGPALLL